MNITYETLVNSSIPYKTDRTIENTLWIWNQIKTDFNMNEWYIVHLSPLKRHDRVDLFEVHRFLVNSISGVIDSRAYRKGWKTRFYAALEGIDESFYGDHFHCLLHVPGGMDDQMEGRIKRKLNSMEIFRGSSRAVRIRPLCPSRTISDVIQTLHYLCKQTTQNHDPYAYYK